MTASLIAQQEARGVRFDAIAAADREIAQAAVSTGYRPRTTGSRMRP
ncbi:hypothetical protein [Cryobacterium tagatosivorans]|nr:hypothetical protein [Cryobacterium tagatosivorans]